MRFDPVTIRGAVIAPPDKSISHRAALIGAMASEPVRVTGYLDAADTNSTLAAVQQLGALVEVKPDEIVIRGSGLREARSTDRPIDVGNAGTLMRLLPGWLAGQEGRAWTLDGDSSILKRPVDRVPQPPGRPIRRAAGPHGRPDRGDRRRLPAVRGARHAPARDPLRAADGQRPGEVVRAAGRAVGRRRHDGHRAGAQPRPHRAHAGRR